MEEQNDMENMDDLRKLIWSICHKGSRDGAYIMHISDSHGNMPVEI